MAMYDWNKETVEAWEAITENEHKVSFWNNVCLILCTCYSGAEREEAAKLLCGLLEMHYNACTYTGIEAAWIAKVKWQDIADHLINQAADV